MEPPIASSLYRPRVHVTLQPLSFDLAPADGLCFWVMFDIQDSMSGVLITKAHPLAPASEVRMDSITRIHGCGTPSDPRAASEPCPCLFVDVQVLKRGDVLVGVDNIVLANDGTIPFRKGERVELHYYFQQLYKGDMVNLKIYRDSQVREGTLT